jgi:hypothetical protein
MTNQKIKTMQRKIKDMKVRLKQRLVSKSPKESKEPNHDTSDFICLKRGR